MPLFLDVHSIATELSMQEVAGIHKEDVEILAGPGARCLRHWVSTSVEKMFCLIEADDATLARDVHASTHGVATEECHPVSEYI